MNRTSIAILFAGVTVANGALVDDLPAESPALSVIVSDETAPNKAAEKANAIKTQQAAKDAVKYATDLAKEQMEVKERAHIKMEESARSVEKAEKDVIEAKSIEHETKKAAMEALNAKMISAASKQAESAEADAHHKEVIAEATSEKVAKLKLKERKAGAVIGPDVAAIKERVLAILRQRPPACEVEEVLKVDGKLTKVEVLEFINQIQVETTARKKVEQDLAEFMKTKTLFTEIELIKKSQLRIHAGILKHKAKLIKKKVALAKKKAEVSKQMRAEAAEQMRTIKSDAERQADESAVDVVASNNVLNKAMSTEINVEASETSKQLGKIQVRKIAAAARARGAKSKVVQDVGRATEVMRTAKGTTTEHVAQVNSAKLALGITKPVTTTDVASVSPAQDPIQVAVKAFKEVDVLNDQLQKTVGTKTIVTDAIKQVVVGPKNKKSILESSKKPAGKTGSGLSSEDASSSEVAEVSPIEAAAVIDWPVAASASNSLLQEDEQIDEQEDEQIDGQQEEMVESNTQRLASEVRIMKQMQTKMITLLKFAENKEEDQVDEEDVDNNAAEAEEEEEEGADQTEE